MDAMVADAQPTPFSRGSIRTGLGKSIYDAITTDKLIPREVKTGSITQLAI